MVKPAPLNTQPSLVLTTVGGVVGTILLSALIHLAPALGFPFIDVPRLVGGIFTGDPTAAFWLGFWLFFVVGWLVFAPPLSVAWSMLPAEDVGFTGAAAKGALWGAALWALSGVLLPLFGALNRLPGAALEPPGFFALGAGPLGMLGLLLGHLAYGLAVALIAAMGRGITPLDTIGWMGYSAGE